MRASEGGLGSKRERKGVEGAGNLLLSTVIDVPQGTRVDKKKWSECRERDGREQDEGLH